MPGGEHMNKYIILLAVSIATSASCITIDIDIDSITPQDTDQAIKALSYIREENKIAAERLQDLYSQTEDAVELSSLSKLIDVLLQSCIYLAERIKHFEENFKKKIFITKEIKQ